MAHLRSVVVSIVLAAVALGIGCEKRGDSVSSWYENNKGMLAEPEEDADEREIMPFTHYAAGQLFEKQQQYPKAVEQYRRAIAQDPDFIPAYNRLGICLDRIGQYKEADACFREAIRLAPERAYLRNNLSFSLMLQKRWPEAERELRAACELQPNYDRARVNLGIVLARQAQFKKAYAQFEPVLGAALAHYNMGLLYKSSGMPEQAADSFRSALVAKPDLTQAQDQLSGMQPQVSWEGNALDAVAPKESPRARPTAPPRPSRIVTEFEVPEPTPPAAQTAPVAARRPVKASSQATLCRTETLSEAEALRLLDGFALREPSTSRSQKPASASPAVREPQATGVAAPQREPALRTSAPRQVEPAATAPVARTAGTRQVSHNAIPAYLDPIPVFLDEPDEEADDNGDLPLALLATVVDPSMLPVTLEPCEIEDFERDVADVLRQLQPCRGNEVVDQFVFGHMGHDDSVVSSGPADRLGSRLTNPAGHRSSARMAPPSATVRLGPRPPVRPVQSSAAGTPPSTRREWSGRDQHYWDLVADPTDRGATKQAAGAAQSR